MARRMQRDESHSDNFEHGMSYAPGDFRGGHLRLKLDLSLCPKARRILLEDTECLHNWFNLFAPTVQ
jgi:hypothetical protein